MFRGATTAKKVMGLFSLLLLLVSFGFAYFHIQSMSATDMPMPGCPFMSEQSVLCTMSPLEHIEVWQDIFTAIPTAEVLLLLSLLLLALYTLQRLPTKWPQPIFQAFYIQQPYRTPRLSFSSYLAQAFSDGVLNPKLF
mgnify:CR=1 FL=1